MMQSPVASIGRAVPFAAWIGSGIGIVREHLPGADAKHRRSRDAANAIAMLGNEVASEENDGDPDEQFNEGDHASSHSHYR